MLKELSREIRVWYYYNFTMIICLHLPLLYCHDQFMWKTSHGTNKHLLRLYRSLFPSLAPVLIACSMQKLEPGKTGNKASLIYVTSS